MQSKVGVAVRGVKVTAKDAANGQTLTFTASPLPAGLTINHATGVISGKPKSLAVDRTVVTATDKRLNRAGRHQVEGRRAHQDLTITDNAAHDMLTVHASGLPPGVALHRNPLVLRGRPAATGTYQVTITVSGRDGGFARVRFRIRVEPRNGAIAVRIVLPVNCRENAGSTLAIGQLAAADGGGSEVVVQSTAVTSPGRRAPRGRPRQCRSKGQRTRTFGIRLSKFIPNVRGWLSPQPFVPAVSSRRAAV